MLLGFLGVILGIMLDFTRTEPPDFTKTEPPHFT
jgi:hypothetical protein